ncbi:MAG: hypoxanthine phosphoribosyltransferase [Candidatus Dormibacteria bacterium]
MDTDRPLDAIASAPTAGGRLRLAGTLLEGPDIQRRIAELAGEIDAVYRDAAQPLVLLCVLKGSVLFTADLSRRLSVPVEYEFIAVRSYGDEVRSSGQVEMVKDVGMSLRDRDVLMVEDIIDTGLTTHFLYEHLQRHQPRSLRLVALLNKHTSRQREVRIDFSGFDIPDRFVVGYGLDLAEAYRNLPDIRLIEGA